MEQQPEEFASRAQRRAALMRNRAQEGSPRRKILTLVLTLALISALMIGTYALNGGTFAFLHSGPVCSQTSKVLLIADPDIAPALSTAARNFNDTPSGRCTEMQVRAQSPGKVAAAIATNKTSADIWATSTDAWLERVNTATGKNLTAGPTFATSPILVHLPASKANLFGNTPPNWAKIITSKPQTVAASPEDSSAGLYALAAMSQAITSVPNNNQSAQVQAVNKFITQATAKIPSDRPYLSAEVTFATVHAKTDGTLIRPAGGTPLVAYALTNINSDPRIATTTKDFNAYLRSTTGQNILRNQGLRSADGSQDPLQARPATGTLRAIPISSKNLFKTQSVYDAATSQTQMLALIDVSGSMGQPNGNNPTLIEQVMRTSDTAITSLPGETSISLWEFALNLDGRKPYKRLTSYGQISDPAHAAKLKAGIESLPIAVREGHDTGLYESIWAAYQYALKNYAPGKVNSVVLLTDGQNYPGGQDLMTLEELKAKLKAAQDPRKPITLVTIGLTGGVDSRVLNDLAKITGSKYYSAEEAGGIDKVISLALYDRTCVAGYCR